MHGFSVGVGGQDRLGVAVVIDPLVPWYRDIFDLVLSKCRSAVRRVLGGKVFTVVERLVTFVADWWTWIIILSFIPWVDWEWLRWVGLCTWYFGLLIAEYAGRALGLGFLADVDDDWIDDDDDGGGSDYGGDEERRRGG